MVDFKNEQLYRQDSVDKQLKITFDSGTITNSEIPSEQFELTESLTSESQLVFGSCEASEIKFRIYNVFLPLKDKWLTVTQTLNVDTENPLQIGKYKVYSDKPTADRGYRDVVAYDAMYDIISTDVASWYNRLTFPMQLKAFRDSFFAFFDIEQEEVSLVNDSMEIERTIDVQVLSGKDVIQSICEINGCFGHIARNGKFKYVFLETIMGGLYPSNEIYPANDLYPQQPNVQIVGSGLYVDTPTYEDFTVKPIDKLQIREKEGDIGVIVGDGDNTYIVEDNFLVYGKSAEELTVIAENMLSVIDGLEYRPFDATLVGNPCLEVGDNVRLHTKYQIIDSYVLQRTLSGVQALRDEFSAEGEEYQSEKVNDIQTDIKQLKGKSNTLERTIEETRSTIANMEEGLQSEITQTAESIRLEVADETNQLSSEIEQTNSHIVLGVNSQGKMVLVELSADRNTGTVFTVNADNIDLSAEDVINLMAGGTINLTGKNIEIDSDNFSVDSDGNMSCNNASVTGNVNATTLNVKDKLTLYSRRVTGNIDDYVDAIWTSWELDSSQNYYQALYSNIEYFKKNIHAPNAYVDYLGSSGNIYAGGEAIIVGNINCQSNISSPGVMMTSHSRPITNKGAQCGLDSYRWSQIWGADGQISTSDRNEKHDINPISNKYEELFKRLQPITYVFNDRSRTHVGFISQDVEQALIDSEIDSNDFAGFCKGVKSEVETIDGIEVEVPIIDENGNTTPTYSLRYSEFIALNTHMIQQAYKKIETQQQEIDTLKEQVSFLMQKLGDDSNG